MSTKIHDGLRLADPNADLFRVVATVSTAVTQRFHEARRRLVAEEFARAVDYAPREGARTSPFTDAREQWRDRQAKYGERSALHDPLRFSIVFGKARSGHTLALPFTGSVDYIVDALEPTGLFTKYGYWDNTDRPAELTKGQWRERRDDWDSIEDRDAVYSHLPMWQLNSLGESFMVEFDLDYSPSDYFGARERFREALVSALVRDSEPFDKERIMSVFYDARRLARDFTASLPDDSELFPAPLPDLHVRYDDLDGPLEITQDTIAAARAHEATTDTD